MKVTVEVGNIGDHKHVVLRLFSSDGESYGTITADTRLDLGLHIIAGLSLGYDVEIVDDCDVDNL
ncbi:MAG: hypothetical protein BWY63_02735 [Chloroflexi bacterium ADurb.Bin360]|nr:MAG: hypothetical protein BWY63_02735 [Chloroflexi bacterium ADurb.Bin360]